MRPLALLLSIVVTVACWILLLASPDNQNFGIDVVGQAIAEHDGKLVLQAREKAVKIKRRKPVKGQRPDQLDSNLNPDESEVYLNTYHIAPFGQAWNKLFGKFVPMYHSSVQFKGPRWAVYNREGSEFEMIDSDEDDRGIVPRENNPSRRNGYKLHKSTYMGTTRMDPIEVRKHIDTLRTEKKYNKYHLTKRNCNTFAEELLQKSLGRKTPKKNNRFARLLGRFGLNRLPLG